MNKRQLTALKKIGFWSNRICDAWSMGEADWAYTDATNPTVLTTWYLAQVPPHGDEALALEAAASTVESLAKLRHIDPTRHHWHKR